MILSPLQDGAMFGKADWIRTAPRISQYFGGNYVTYVRFGMKGHNGIDFVCPIGTPIFAPFDGEVTALETTDGYGIHAKIRSRDKLLECVLGHLSQIKTTKRYVKMGDVIGYSGNTGFSTGPHLHFGVRRLLDKKETELSELPIEDYGNGFFGYFDPLPFLIRWKGTFEKNSL